MSRRKLRPGDVMRVSGEGRLAEWWILEQVGDGLQGRELFDGELTSPWEGEAMHDRRVAPEKWPDHVCVAVAKWRLTQ